MVRILDGWMVGWLDGWMVVSCGLFSCEGQGVKVDELYFCRVGISEKRSGNWIVGLLDCWIVGLLDFKKNREERKTKRTEKPIHDSRCTILDLRSGKLVMN